MTAHQWIRKDVAIKWLLSEEDQPRALHIRGLYDAGVLSVIAPGLIAAEIGNVLWNYVTRGLLTGPDAERAPAGFTGV